MSDIKWIKVAVDMFEDNKIEFIRSLPEGDAIIVTWIQMLSIAGQSNMSGYLMVAEDIPYTEQLLATKLRRSPMVMQFALDTLQKLKMINMEDGPYHITNWEKHQNVEGMDKVRLLAKERKQRQRLREKESLLLQNPPVSRDSHVTVTENVTHVVTPCHAIELDKEKESSSSPPNAFDVYQNTIGMISPTIQEMLEDNILTYGERMLCEAIKEAARQGKNKLSYVEGILRKWHTDGRGKGPKQYVAHHDLPTEAEVRASERRKQEELDKLNIQDLM